jgi:broad specificity phosphatase PhoE
MTTFLLVRHGETDAVGKSIMGWRPGWHLNPKGRAEVKTLAERLARMPVRAVYTSPLERAIETAAEIARPHGLEPQPVEEFGEFHAGEWEGLALADLDSRDDWRRFNHFRAGTRAPGGELMIETQARMIRQLDLLRGRHGEETVAVVSHGDPLRSVVAYYLGIPLDLILRFEIHTASLSVLQLAEWGARILCVNHKDEIALEGS